MSTPTGATSDVEDLMTGDRGPLAEIGEHRLRRTEREALLNLQAVLRLCETGQLRCSDKTARPSAATVRLVGNHLVGGDFYAEEPVAAFAWPLLLQAGGLAKIDGGRLQLTAAGRTALRRPTPVLIRKLWQRWISHGVIDELSRVEAIKGQRSANVLTAVKGRRQIVAAALATLQPEQWIGVDTFFSGMRRRGLVPHVARSERAQWRLYLVEAQYGSLGYDMPRRWEMLEGRYTLAVLFEYAAALGLIDVDYVHPSGARDDYHDAWGADEYDALSRYDGLQAVRLTALGSYALGLTEEYAADDEPAAALQVRGLEVVATGPLPADDELVLAAFARPTVNGIWSVSEESLLAAFDAGRTPKEFADFLTARVESGVTGPLRNLLDDITGRVGQLRDLGTARIIGCRHPELATFLAAHPALAGLCRRIGETELLVPAGHDENFRAAVRALGYVLPK